MHKLPPLPYAYNALEPYIDAHALRVHHDGHHAAYVENLNAALDKWPMFQGRPASWLLRNLNKMPRSIRTTIRNNAGGHLNHCLYWQAMSPSGGGAPSGLLADAIRRDFGSVEKFRVRFNKVAAAVFGSGWAWLARSQLDGGKLVVLATSGHNNPLMRGQYPILVNDVWEHAYYLKYENRKSAYLEEWWSLTNWKMAERRFESSDQSAEQDWEDEGGAVLSPSVHEIAEDDGNP